MFVIQILQFVIVLIQNCVEGLGQSAVCNVTRTLCANRLLQSSKIVMAAWQIKMLFTAIITNNNVTLKI